MLLRPNLLLAMTIALCSAQVAHAASKAGHGMSASSAIEDPLPEALRATIDAAIASGDEKAVATIIRFAHAANPELGTVLEDIHSAYRKDLDRRQDEKRRLEREQLIAASAFEYWDGQAEIGASRSTGKTDSLGIYASLNANREGVDWRHKLIARADIQKTNGVTTTERVLLSWQPNYKFDDRLYAFGLGQFEHDRPLGYDARYTAGGGLGYELVSRPQMKLELEGGPALRYTDTVDEGEAATIAGRTSVNFRWKVSPTLEVSQNGALYYEPGERSASVLTAVDTRLLGPLKARFSYNVQYESDARERMDALETVSRATLVYSF